MKGGKVLLLHIALLWLGRRVKVSLLHDYAPVSAAWSCTDGRGNARLDFAQEIDTPALIAAG